MSDHMKKVQSGDPLVVPAQAYNAFIDAAKDFRQRTQHLGQTATPGYRSAGIVLVKNESGDDRQRFDILGLGDPIFLPDAGAAAEQSFKNAVALRGEMPDATLHEGKFVILAEPLAAGAIGRAYLAGVTAVRLRLEDSAQQVARAEIIDADAAALQPATDGAAQVLWHQQQTGDVWAISPRPASWAWSSPGSGPFFFFLVLLPKSCRIWAGMDKMTSARSSCIDRFDKNLQYKENADVVCQYSSILSLSSSVYFR